MQKKESIRELKVFADREFLDFSTKLTIIIEELKGNKVIHIKSNYPLHHIEVLLRLYGLELKRILDKPSLFVMTVVAARI